MTGLRLTRRGQALVNALILLLLVVVLYGAGRLGLDRQHAACQQQPSTCATPTGNPR